MPLSPPLAALAPGLSAAGKLDRDDIDALARMGVRTIVNNRPDGEDPGQLPAAEARAARRGARHRLPPHPGHRRDADRAPMSTPLPRRWRARRSRSSSHCRSGTRSTLLWALVRMREGADPFALVAEAARHGIDIAALPAIAARLR